MKQLFLKWSNLLKLPISRTPDMKANKENIDNILIKWKLYITQNKTTVKQEKQKQQSKEQVRQRRSIARNKNSFGK